MAEATSAPSEPPGPDKGTLQSLTPEERKGDLYITAIHELERRRQHWSVTRLTKIASDLGIDHNLLRVTWCLFQVTKRRRRKPAPARVGAHKAFRRILGERECKSVPLPGAVLEHAREALLDAAWRGHQARRDVRALLRGRVTELRLREDAEFVDEEDSDDEDGEDEVVRLARRAVERLPGVAGMNEEVVTSVSERVAEFARGIGTDGGDGVDRVSKEAMGMARHRCRAVEWMFETERTGRTGESGSSDSSDMGRVIDEISSEAGVRLHAMTKRALSDAFPDEGSLAEGGLKTFRALVPDRFARAVTEREVRRLVGAMKTRDMETAEGLVRRFGSARRALRAGATEMGGRRVAELVHGYDAEFHGVVEGGVRDVWVVARVLKERFGDLDRAREAGFWEIVGGGDEVVTLTVDERLAGYRGLHRDSAGVARERFGVMWGLFRGVCESGVEDAVGAMGRVIAEFGCEGRRLVGGMADADTKRLCSVIGIDSDAVARLTRVTNDLRSGNALQSPADKYPRGSAIQ